MPLIRRSLLASSIAALAATLGAGVARADSAELIPVLTRLLRTYEGCIIERYETPATAGLERRDGSTCALGNACSRAQRERAFATLSAQARRGDDRDFSDQLQRALLADCMSCQKHGKWHTKHVHCTMDCGGNRSRGDPAGWGIGPCFEGCKAGVDITRWLSEAARDIAQALGAAKPTEAADHLGGARIAKNHRVVQRLPSESCQPFVVGRDYFPPPSAALDWTPTSAPPFRITLIESLKVLLLATGGVGSALASFLGPLVAGGFAGGLTAIALGGVPSVAIGLPQGPAPTKRDYDPAHAKNLGANEGRLVEELRAAARAADPIASLCKSAEAFALRRAVFDRAFADLAVTGKRAFAAFKRLAPKDESIVACLRSRGGKAVRALPDRDLRDAARAALDRAYTVARLLRGGGWPKRCLSERRALGWIAVSGEDDQPHRPVNVGSSEFPQHDLAVSVGGLTVNTRYVIAHAKEPAPPPSCAGPKSPRSLAAEPGPRLAPDSEVILYVHGMDSRLEEALDLARSLHKLSGATKRNWTVLSVDLPTSGYADNLDHRRVSPLEALGETKFRFHGAADLELTDLQVFSARSHDTPLLKLIEQFVVSFVDRLDRLVPIKARLRAVVGGSLGGNMSLRLGRRAESWIRNVVPWSPAAIWPSFADGANPGNHLGVAIPILWAGGDRRVLEETPVQRREFFYKAFDWTAGLLKRKPQALEWYREGWGPSEVPGVDCKTTHLRGARVDRYETYDARFRLWHWRLGAEQLIFSHQSPGPDGKPLYLRNRKPTLLMCGFEDTGGDLCKHTRDVAPKMVNTPGRALFLEDTGHSIHNERPCWLARHIAEFLGASPPARCP